MKMVKSLLLGSAATLVAAAGAQAADLPMKAKAVEYVKVCSLYGAGYYYIPGTDTCIKIGGFVRADYVFHGAPSGASAFVGGADARFNQAETRYYDWRMRTQFSFDVRSQTEYGTLRSYARLGFQYTTGGAPSSAGESTFAKDAVPYVDRGFIQFAGFTFGKTQSFFDSWSAGMGMANSNLFGYSDTGNGITLAAYTALLGNGVSASIAVEDPAAHRRVFIYDTSKAANNLVFGASPALNGYGGTQMPDIVGTLRVDQAWGTALVGGLVHELLPTYYGGTTAASVTSNGKADTKYGWAVTGALDLNLPWAKGDRFTVSGVYTQGVMGTLNQGPGNNAFGVWSQNSSDITTAWFFDSVNAGVGTQQELTTGYGGVAGVEHYWVPNLRSSVFGSYTAIRYNGVAKGYLCSAAAWGAFTIPGSCNPDFDVWQVGSRTVWSVVPNLDLSIEGLYTKIDQNNVGTSTIAAGAMPTGVARNFVDQDVWSLNFRVQRNFWP